MQILEATFGMSAIGAGIYLSYLLWAHGPVRLLQIGCACIWALSQALRAAGRQYGIEFRDYMRHVDHVSPRRHDANLRRIA